jgi:chromosome segregation ATPase
LIHPTKRVSISEFDQRLEDQQREAKMNLQNSCRALENSIEAKCVQVRDLQSRLVQITATVDEWEGKYDAVTKERDSQKQFLVAERQKYKEYVTVKRSTPWMLTVRLERALPERNR